MITEHDRDLLLAYLYDALEPAERAALEARLASEPELAQALDTARAERALLDEAASLPADNLELSPRGRSRIFTFRGVRAAAAVLLVVAGGLLGYRAVARASVAEHTPVVHVAGPTFVAPGESAEYVVDVAELDGDAYEGRLIARLIDGNGDERAKQVVDLDDDGRARVHLTPDVPRPGEWYVARFETDVTGVTKQAAVATRLRDTTRVITRVSSEKPVYRPGETVRVRGVALESLRLAPAGNVPLRLKLLDPRGGVVLDRNVPSRTGVTAWEHELPADAQGGSYTLELSGIEGQEESVAPSSQAIAVRAYRAPRLLFDVELDRASYGPGQEGNAWAQIERVEGGVPTGASLEATLYVGDERVDRHTLTVGPSGGVVVPFRVPTNVTEGRARLALSVDDGGSVEGFARTVPLAVGRVRVDLYPEGGTLVAGLPNRTYFRAETADGLPADVLVAIDDESGAQVATGRVDVHGMGTFEMTPRADATYTLRAIEPTGIDVVAEFPEVAADGVVLRARDDVTREGAPLRVRLTATHGGNHTVWAWLRGHQVGVANVTLAAGEPADVDVPLRTNCGGVVRVTVSDPTGVPVAERLVSRAPSKSLDVQATAERDTYGPRERVAVTISVRDEAGMPATAILGAAVVDEGALALGETPPPLPLHFLLGMEVDRLENADLFTGGPGAPLAVDRLLGVQGWRRFAWRSATEFREAHPIDGPRVVAITPGDVPLTRTNERDVESSVRGARRRIDENTGGVAVLAGLLFLVVGGIWIGLRGVWQHRPWAAAGGFAVPTLAVLLAVAALNNVGGMAPVADMVMAPGMRAAGMDAGGVESEGVWGGDATESKSEDILEEQAGLDRVMALKRQVEFADDRNANDFFDLDGTERQDAKYVLTREYAHRATKPFAGERTDFEEVLYWRPILVTDDAGQATFEFDTSDSITRFRVSVDAHDGRGALGTGTSTIATRLPFHAEPKLPLEVAAGDRVDIPVSLVNDSARTIRGWAGVDATGDLVTAPRRDAEPFVDLAPGERGRVLAPIDAGQGRGTVRLRIAASTDAGFRDMVERELRVAPRGYPVTVSRSGAVSSTSRGTAPGGSDTPDALPEGTVRAVIRVPETFEPSSLRGGLRLYPSTLATLVDGLDGILQEPHGCFEQTSSSNYPNVLALGYLEEQGLADPLVARKARDYLAAGYKRLLSYECSDGGFEWFGNDPAHEALTAYGLLEFVDMARVFDVDPDVIDRTRDWLLARRNGNGGFRLDEQTLDHFGGASRDVTESYIVWALTEAGGSGELASELATELDALADRAARSDDAYFVALAFLALDNAADARADALLDRLAGIQATDGHLTGATTSITSSRGANLDIETTALGVMAFDRRKHRLANAEAGVRFILGNRQDGRFGATQATVLALRALTTHARAARTTSAEHRLQIFVNGAQVAGRHVPRGAPGVIEVGPEILAALRPGDNAIDISTDGDEELPWALTVGFHTSVPANDPACPVTITTTLSAARAAEGESVGLTATITNTTADPLPMTLARVGFPAGLTPRTERLDELRKAGALAFYEVSPREVTLYWRTLAASETKEIAFDLTATVPGLYEGPASAAYLYYGDDAKQWAAPLDVTITPR